MQRQQMVIFCTILASKLLVETVLIQFRNYIMQNYLVKSD